MTGWMSGSGIYTDPMYSRLIQQARKTRLSAFFLFFSHPALLFFTPTADPGTERTAKLKKGGVRAGSEAEERVP